MAKDLMIDAKGKKLGRLATEIALVLRGKDKSTFTRHVMPMIKVTVLNAGGLDTTERRLRTITHKRYSGYPGGLKVLSGTQVVAVKGKGELLRKAVYGMLPKNSHRPKLMKNLIISE